MSSLWLPRDGVQPSYSAGFARSAAESANPGLWDGLVGAWIPCLGVTGGTIRDVSGRKSNGSLVNDAAWVIKDGSPALDFDGSWDYVDLDVAVPHIDTAQGTMSIWAWMDSTIVSGSYHTIWEMSNNASTDNFIGLRKDSTNGLCVARYRVGAVNKDVNITVSGIAWMHLVLTWSAGGGIEGFLDGRPQGTNTRSGDITGLNTCVLATKGQSTAKTGMWWFGALRDAAIYDRVLTPNEIRHLYIDPLAPFRLAPLWVSVAGAEAAAEYPQFFYGSRKMTPLIQM